MRLFLKSISSILAITLILSALPVYTHAEEIDNDPVIVVSLGDSYSSGEGIEPFYGQEKSLFDKVEDIDWLAHRSKKSWPSLLKVPGIEDTMGDYRADYGAESDECEWYFGAVSGAETKHFNNEQQKKKYVKDTSILASMPTFIWGTKPLPKQLDIFDDIDGVVDYVTLTIGGNDVDFAGVITTCVLQPDSLFSGNNGTAWFLDKKMNKLRDKIDDYLSDIKQVYRDIAAKAPQADIIVAGYPKLLSPEGQSMVITRDEAEIVNRNVSWFNEKIKGIIDELDNIINIHFVDVEDEFDRDGGHQAYSSAPWINPIWAGAKAEDINDFSVSSSYSIHPNEEGAKAYARCVNAKIAQIEENKTKTGTLSGKIVKASDRTTPVTTAAVNVVKDNKTISFRPDNNGSYSRELPVGTHYVKVVADGYIEFNAYADIGEDETVYMETFLMVEGEEGQVGEAGGTITNALTGIGIEGVKLDVRSGWNNDSVGDILTTVTTSSSGRYILNLPIGNYTLSASKDGFVTTMINIVVQPNMCTIKDGTMTPVLSGDDYRIVLTWGENPRDLDSHVVGTLTSGESFHVYYGHKSQNDGQTEVCNLDVDDTTSYGPETITLRTTTSKPYYYYIYRYAGTGTVASSGAQINVYQGERLVTTFNVPTNLGSGDYWNVFAIVDGQLVVRNTITSSVETSYANASIATFSLRPANQNEHPVYDDAYPAKNEPEVDATDPTEEVPATEAPTMETTVGEDVAVETEITEATAATEETLCENDIAPATDLDKDFSEQIETETVYLDLNQVDQDYTWFAETKDAAYNVVKAEDENINIYSVDLPMDTETIILRGKNDQGEEVISSVEISLTDIQDYNCIVAVAGEKEEEFEIAWGSYDSETGDVTIETAETLTIGEEDAEEDISTEATESSDVVEKENTEESPTEEEITSAAEFDAETLDDVIAANVAS